MLITHYYLPVYLYFVYFCRLILFKFYKQHNKTRHLLMKKLLLLLLLITPMYFASCSDDDENNTPKTENGDDDDNVDEPTEVKKRITKITITEESEIITKEFKYDQSGNLSTYIQTDTDKNGDSFSETYNFIYEGDKLVKSNIIYGENDPENEFSEYKYHLDTVFATETVTLYVDTLIIKDGLLIKDADKYEINTFEYDSNKNLKKENWQTRNSSYITTGIYTYDDKLSIFSNQGNFPIWYWLYTGYGEHSYTGRNNIATREGTDGYSDDVYKSTFSYEYDNDGYPTICNATDTEIGTSKMIFEYEIIK